MNWTKNDDTLVIVLVEDDYAQGTERLANTMESMRIGHKCRHLLIFSSRTKLPDDEITLLAFRQTVATLGRILRGERVAFVSVAITDVQLTFVNSLLGVDLPSMRVFQDADTARQWVK